MDISWVIELSVVWMSLWTIVSSTRRIRRLILKFAVTILWSESAMEYALHFRIEFLHFPLSKIWSICTLWVPSGCSQAHMWFFCMWLKMESSYKFTVLTQINKSFPIIDSVLVIWVSANDLWGRIMRNLSNTCIEISKNNNKVMSWYWRDGSM